MRHFVFCALASALVTSAAVAAPKTAKPAKPAPASTQILVKGLQAMAAPIAMPGASPNAAPSQSQGANHASDNAKSRVCTHDNPSSRRSAICTRPISPD